MSGERFVAAGSDMQIMSPHSGGLIETRSRRHRMRQVALGVTGALKMSKNRRNALLGGASVTAMSLMMGMTPVQAQATGATIAVPFTEGGLGAARATGNVIEADDLGRGVAVSSVLRNGAGASAVLDDVALGTSVTGVAGGANTSRTVANGIVANAFGNDAELEIDLDVLASETGNGSIAAIVAAENTTGAGVFGAARDSEIAARAETTDDPAVLSMNVEGNTIEARAILNRSATTTIGTVPTTATSTASGRTSFDIDGSDGAFLESEGTIAIGNAQLNINAGPGREVGFLDEAGAVVENRGSGALIEGNTVRLDIVPSGTAEGTATVVGSPTIADNTLRSVYAGNDATTNVVLQGGRNPAFQGSVTVSNVQSNSEGGSGDDFSARVSDNRDTDIIARVNRVEDELGSAFSNDVSGLSRLSGVLSVTDNAVVSTGAGNRAVNQLAMTGGLNFTGSSAVDAGEEEGGADLPPAIVVDVAPGSSIALDGSAGSANVDLALTSAQSNTGTSTNTRTEETDIRASVAQSEAGGSEAVSVVVAGNRVDSFARGNDAVNTLRNDAPRAAGADGQPVPSMRAAGFAGSAALSNAQRNDDFSDVSALADDVDVHIELTDGTGGFDDERTGTLTGASLALAGNGSLAGASGNLATNSVSIDAATVSLGGGLASVVRSETSSTVAAGLSLGNVQSSANRIDAESDDVEYEVDIQAGTFANGSLSLDGNTIAAAADGNAASNVLNLSGTTVTGGAALASTQTRSGFVEAEVEDAGIEYRISADLTDSTATLDDNTIGATARGNAVSNSLVVTATTLNVPAFAGDEAAPAASFDPATGRATPVAGSVISNAQTLDGDVSAVGDLNNERPFYIALDGTMDGSSLSLAGNSYGTTALGNASTFAATDADGNALAAMRIAANQIVGATDAAAPVGVLSSVQTRLGGSDVTAVNEEDDDRPSAATFRLYVADDVTDSAVGMRGNVGSTIARGNVATGNSLSVTANTVDVAGSSGGLLRFEDGSIADAAFVVQNVQSGGTGVIRSAQENQSARVRIEGDLTGSAIAVDENGFVALASDNLAANSLTLNVDSLSAGSGLQNDQVSAGTVIAELGVPAEPAVAPTDDAPFEVVATASELLAVVDTVAGTAQIEGGTLTVNAAGLTEAQRGRLAATGWTFNGDANTFTRQASPVLGTISEARFTALRDGGTEAFALVVPGTPGSPATPANPSIIVALEGDVLGSTIAVTGSEAITRGIGNQASNLVSIKGNRVIGEGAGAAVGLGAGDTGAVAAANHAIQNTQTQSATASATSSANATFAIDVNDIGFFEEGVDTLAFGTVTDSSLAVTGSRVEASAGANSSVSRLTLTANDTTGDGGGSATSLAILSEQSALGAISATSQMNIGAPVAVAGSSVSMSENVNLAQSIANNAQNEIRVAATNVGTGAGAFVGATGVIADHVLANRQTVGTQVIAGSATTNVSNQEFSAAGTFDVGGSRVILDENETVTSLIANNANNRIVAGGSSSQTASSGVLNTQTSGASLAATATGNVDFAVRGTEGTRIAGSSVGISENVTLAQSTANNALNRVEATGSSVGAALEAAPGAIASLAGDVAAEATNALVNSQAATGASSSTAALNVRTALTGAGTSMAGSTLDVVGNIGQADANGNVATNELVANGTAELVASGVLSSLQSHSAGVTATAATVIDLGAASSMGVSGSTLNLTGNGSLARAASNDVRNTVTASGANIAGGRGSNATVDITSDDGVRSAAISATHGLSNVQQSSGATSASSTLTMPNAITGTSATALAGSSMTVSGNQSQALADGNRAINTLNLNAGANLSATGALSNLQDRAALGTVTATATGSLTPTLTGAVTGLAGSSLNLVDNRVAAQASGNSAVNAVNARGGAGVTGTPGVASASVGFAAGSSSAAYTVLNSQSNAAAVRSTATGTMATALNGGMTGSTARVQGNSVAALAVGNGAQNTVMLSALTGGSGTAALANSQVNSGAVRAVASGTSISAGSSGLTSGSSLAVASNTISATAVGNSVRSVIRAD